MGVPGELQRHALGHPARDIGLVREQDDRRIVGDLGKRGTEIVDADAMNGTKPPRRPIGELVAEPGETPGDAAAYRFILVGETHHLAPSADLDIRVASAAELRHRPLHPGEVALVLPAESPQRPHLVPTSAPRPTRVAAVQ